MTDVTAEPKPAIDKKALLAKYIAERDKRLRADGNSQYLEIKGRLSHYLEDPYTPRVEREPKTDHVKFAFIGGGFAGLVTGARLKEAGITDVRIVEKGGDFGPYYQSQRKGVYDAYLARLNVARSSPAEARAKTGI